MAVCLESGQTTQYKATQLWQEIVHGFRNGMPTSRHRIRMKSIEDSFTANEATEWLTSYLQRSDHFETVTKEQVITLLQKFLQCDVIEDVKNRNSNKFETGNHLYRFVTSPSLLNFLETTPIKPHLQTDDVCISNPCIAFNNSQDELDSEHGSSTVTDHSSTVTDHSSTVTDHSSTVTDHSSTVTDHNSTVTDHSSTVTDHSSTVTDHNSTVTDHSSKIDINNIWKNVIISKLSKYIELPLNIDDIECTNITSNVQRNTTPKDDIPSWIIMAFKCLSKWPDHCPQQITGGLPLYKGFQYDVLQSLTNYFTQKPHPLIPLYLYPIYMSVLPLIEVYNSQTTEILQMITLLLPTTSYIAIHRLLRFIYKTNDNNKLKLSHSLTNKEFLLETFALGILRPAVHVITCDLRQKIVTVLRHMVDNYRQIFKISEEIQREVEREIEREVERERERERFVRHSYCQRVTQQMYEIQKDTIVQRELEALLDNIVRDENMSTKVKKQRLKQFKRTYPDIYSRQYPGGVDCIRPSQRHGRMTTSRSGHF